MGGPHTNTRVSLADEGKEGGYRGRYGMKRTEFRAHTNVTLSPTITYNHNAPVKQEPIEAPFSIM